MNSGPPDSTLLRPLSHPLWRSLSHFHLLIAFLIGSLFGPNAISLAEEMFPFVIPGLKRPSEKSIVNMSWLNEAPAGKHGFLSVRDGHFVDERGERVQFLATNMTFGSCFPDHETADKLAPRLASLGINCVRFHHMDNASAPRGIWKARSEKKNEFDPQQLDRLDYFIAALKRHGIYTNLNLHVSRNYWEGEDFPDGLSSEERRELLPRYGKGIDKINDQMMRMQRDYAQQLLAHVNPYTKNSYATEPAVAIVELNNENSLLRLKVESLPEYYRAEILKKWNTWLSEHYATEEKLIAAWGAREELGADLLPAQITFQGGKYFDLSQGKEKEANEIRVQLKQRPEVAWHAQLQWQAVPLEEGKLYTVEFSGRSDQARELPLSTRLSKEDYHNCGLSEKVRLTPDWQSFSFSFRARQTEPEAVRLDFIIGAGPIGDFEIKDLTLRPGGSLGLQTSESLSARNIDGGESRMGTPRGVDWTRFLADTERHYNDEMRQLLQKELGVRANIIDSQASYGDIVGTYRESRNDFVDMHAYWQHPSFPGRPWDSNHWFIRNTPMTADQKMGNLWNLAIYRVDGLPFTVSEYDHPAPNHYSAEMFPMIASFAAAQDWDGLFQFDWGGTGWDQQKIGGYFALQQHPAKLAFLPAAALMMRRGDVSPAAGSARLDIPVEAVTSLTAERVSMSKTWLDAGIRPEDILSKRLSLRFVESDRIELKTEAGNTPPQIRWDTQAAIYSVDAPAAKVVVGRCTDKTTELDEVQFVVEPNPRSFAALALNAMDGKVISQSQRLLLTAVGNVENTDMVWNDDHTSLGRRWGTAPTICESIQATVSLNTQMRSTKVYALDGTGERIAEVPANISEGKLVFTIGTPFQTLWYELVGE